VLSVEVLRYLPDPMPALVEMARVLRPGGLLLVTALPRFNLNAYALVNRIAMRVNTDRLTRVQQRFTTSRALRRSMGAAGLEAVEVHGVYLGPVNWIQRLSPSVTPGMLRRWHPIDRRVADRPVLRDLSNMYLAVGRRAE
jgi:2-polyprenyl-3-methyl-5-hydroxy-6-metoxy-1,4-benzoquinol methylase